MHASPFVTLLLTLGGVLGLTSIALGASMVFDEGMSEAAAKNQGAGCFCFSFGLVLLLGCTIGALL